MLDPQHLQLNGFKLIDKNRIPKLLKDARSVSLYPYNWSQVFQNVKHINNIANI